MKRFSLVPMLLVLTFSPLLATADVTTNGSDNTDYTAPIDPPGPLRVGLMHSDEFGSLVDFKWLNHVTDNTAFGFELDFGAREFLLGGTFAYQPTPSQRFKITAEHLAQSFNFVLVGMKHLSQYVGQNLGGLEYEYLVQNPVLNSFDIGAYVAKTENESFAPFVFITPTDINTDTLNVVGGRSRGVAGGVNLTPWNNALVNADLNYDSLTFDTEFEPAKNDHGFGGTLGLTQIFTDHFKMNVAASDRAAFSQIELGADYLLPAKPGRKLELGLDAWHVTGNIPTGSENRVTLSLGFSWGGNRDVPAATYSIDNITNLIHWTDQPALALPEVFLQKDEVIR